MKPYQRIYIPILLVAFMISQPASVMGFGWSDIYDRLWRSAAYVESVHLDEDGKPSVGSCTAFSINEKQGYFMTAGHCAGTMLLDGKPARAVVIDVDNDVMVVQADLHKPALRASRTAVRAGDMAGAFGFAWGFHIPRFHVGYVAATNYTVPVPEFEGPWLSFAFPLIPGMSGGPIVDAEGAVIGVNDWTVDQSGFSRSMDRILSHTRQYWQR